MSAPALETLLARLYSDAAFRARFLADPLGVSKQAGLAEAEALALARIDRVGLELAAESYKRKRMAHQKMPRPGWIARLFR
jgi:hypothetical protein